MEMLRKVRSISRSKPVIEGAGVHLKRVFGFDESNAFDPFLLLDDFRADNPEHYINGFPWHPHRGIETITYVLTGDVEHSDSLGNTGIISSGDVQWMTAGSGIIHQEMPQGDIHGNLEGFQLWANLPASRKMMDPRYRDIESYEIPVVKLENGVTIKIISGCLGETHGPVTDIVIDPVYLDVTVPAHAPFRQVSIPGHTVFVYVIRGTGRFSGTTDAKDTSLILFEDGDYIEVTAGSDPLRFLYISGKPINEPVAWRGPIVMNTREELLSAFEEFQAGTFVKHHVK